MDKINIQTFNEGKAGTLSYKDIALIYDISDLRNMPSINLQTEGFICAYILKGEAQIVVDDESYHVHEGDIFACMPRNILEKSMISVDFDVRAFFLTPDYIEQIIKYTNIDWSIRILANEHKVIHLTSKDRDIILSGFDFIRKIIISAPYPNKDRSLLHAMVSLTLIFYDSWEKQNPSLRSHDGERQHYSTTENLFSNFAKMLANPNHPFVSVNQYAEELCVTPKYFSSVCKKITGKSASEIINEEIIKQAEIMLRDKDMSIKQIADALGFANQSHFGTFFRRHVGISPLHFR